MKITSNLRGIFSLALITAIAALGCENAANGETTPATYTVTYNAGEGSGTPPAPQTVNEGSSISLPSQGRLTAPANKIFDGWENGSYFYAAGDSYTVRRDVTFTAQWKAATDSTSYTVTFNADGGSPASTTRTVTSSGGTVGTLPSEPARTGYTFAGWFTERNGGGTSFTATSAVNADITVYAKWQTADPLLGVWVDYSQRLNYKFTEGSGGTKVYSTATQYTFNVAGTYDINTDRKVLNLYPTNGSPVAKSYEIKGSWLVFDKGRDGETWYTKNPETGGGFNGDLAQGALGGMWQNIVNDTDTFGFNNDGEFFITSGLKNRDGKFWWNVMGEYEYNSTRQVLNLYWNGSGDTIIPDNYTVKFTVGDTVMELTEEYDKSITIFNKRDSL